MKKFKSKKSKSIELSPWKKSLYNARQRCNNSKNPDYKYYGGKGIKCFLSMFEIREIWIRDKANELNRPSLDRKDSNKDYTYCNCRFIELKDNALGSRLNYPKICSLCGNKCYSLGFCIRHYYRNRKFLFQQDKQ